MKTAFVMSGGAALGAWQVGALRALLARGIKPDVCVGTSVGAINAAALAFNSLEELEAIWLSLKSTRDVQRAAWWKGPWARGLYHFGPLKKLLEQRLGSVAQIPAYACYTDLTTGSLRFKGTGDIASREEEFIEYVLASCSVALFHEPIKLPDGSLGVDGGHLEVFPIEFATGRLKADRIIAIGTMPSRFAGSPYEESFVKIVNNGSRALDLMVKEIYRNDIRRCRRQDKTILLTPPAPLPFGAMDYNPEAIRAMMAMGEVEASRALRLWEGE